jgi:TPR repeat protein
VALDVDEAMDWYEKAAKQGHAQAKECMKSLDLSVNRVSFNQCF